MSSVNAPDAVERAVFEIATGIWNDAGQNFFRSLARQLCQALHADFVLIGRLQSGSKVRTLAAHTPAGPVAAFEYELDGTPCAGVTDCRVCSYAEGVHKLFPSDLQLVEMGAEGYVGAPL